MEGLKLKYLNTEEFPDRKVFCKLQEKTKFQEVDYMNMTKQCVGGLLKHGKPIPEITTAMFIYNSPEDLDSYKAWVGYIVPDTVEEEGFLNVILKGAKYALFEFTDDMSRYGEAYMYIYGRWMQENNKKPILAVPSYEQYNVNHSKTIIGVPVE